MLLCQVTENPFGNQRYETMTCASGDGLVKKRKATDEKLPTNVVVESAGSSTSHVRKRPTRHEEENSRSGDSVDVDDDDNGQNNHNSNPTTSDGSSTNLFDEIARELNALTMQEREAILHQLHGVSNEEVVEESHHVITTALSNVQRLLEEERHKPSNRFLRLAEQQYPQRIGDPNFRLMFLRAEDFNVRAAVDRILIHLEVQHILFGNDKVGKRITLDDLSRGDIQALENGHFQVLREKDRAGRLVAFDSICHRREIDFEPDSLVRIGFYTLMAAVEGDEVAQKKGIVFVLSYLGTSTNRKTNGDSFQKATQMFQSLPLKSRGVHACMSPNKILEMFHHFRTFWEKESRLRIRIHQGTFTECKYSLMTFGLPTHCIPLDDQMNLRRNVQLEWMEQRRQIESGLDSNKDIVPTTTTVDPVEMGDEPHEMPNEPTECHTRLITKPSSKDVLFGRGRPIQGHPGNKLLNSLVEAMRERYESLQQRSDKTMVSQMIVAKVKNAGGRFLKPCQQNGITFMWEEADDAEAQAKVSHAFRSLKQLQKSRNQQGKQQPQQPPQQQQDASLFQDNPQSAMSHTSLTTESTAPSPPPTMPMFSSFFRPSPQMTPDDVKRNQWTNL